MARMKTSEKIEARLKEVFLLSLQGDKLAYEEFLNLCSVEIKRLLFFMKGKFSSSENLEDLHQDVLLKIHQKKHTYQTDKPILPWIKAIARYSFIDFYRSQSAGPEEISFDENLLKSEVNQAPDLEEILEHLTIVERDLVERIKLESHSYREVAIEYQVSESALKTRFHRLMKSLKEKARP